MTVATNILESGAILALVRLISWPILLVVFPKRNAMESPTVFDQRPSDSTVIDQHGVLDKFSTALCQN